MSGRISGGIIAQQHWCRIEQTAFAAGQIANGYVTFDGCYTAGATHVSLDGVNSPAGPIPLIACDPNATIVQAMLDGGFTTNGSTAPVQDDGGISGRFELTNYNELRFYAKRNFMSLSGNLIPPTCLLTQYRPGVIAKLQHGVLSLGLNVASGTVTLTYPIPMGRFGWAHCGTDVQNTTTYSGTGYHGLNRRFFITPVLDSSKKTITGITFSRQFAYGDPVDIGWQFWQWL